MAQSQQWGVEISHWGYELERNHCWLTKSVPTDTAKPSNHAWCSPSKTHTHTQVELSFLRATAEENGCAVILVFKTRFNTCLQSEVLTALARLPTARWSLLTQSIPPGTVRNRRAEMKSLVEAFTQLLCDHNTIKQARITTGHAWLLRSTHTKCGEATGCDAAQGSVTSAQKVTTAGLLHE